MAAEKEIKSLTERLNGLHRPVTTYYVEVCVPRDDGFRKFRATIEVGKLAHNDISLTIPLSERPAFSTDNGSRVFNEMCEFNKRGLGICDNDSVEKASKVLGVRLGSRPRDFIPYVASHISGKGFSETKTTKSLLVNSKTTTNGAGPVVAYQSFVDQISDELNWQIEILPQIAA